jgi:CelD/BcsL family acetyltransferase involved in cellulose biosynthesis
MSSRFDFRATAGGTDGNGRDNAAVAEFRITQIDPVADPRWDRFVSGHPRAGAYHLGAWAEVLAAAYRFEPAYLALEGPDRELRGALPLMRTRGLVTGRRLRSLPVVPPAGPLASSDSGEDLAALLRAACRLTDERGSIWTLHAREAGHERLCRELRPVPKHPTWVIELPADIDEMRRGWKKTSNNLFRSLAKSERAGVTVREGTAESDLRAFYRLYLQTMRRRTTLPRLYRQLAKDRELLGPSGAFRLFVAEHDGDVVAGGIYHSFGGTLDLLYNGSDDSRLDVRPNHALYWYAIQWAAANGHEEVDLGHGRPGSSLARFKAQWGAAEVPEYRYDYVPGADAGDGEDGATRSRPRVLEGRGSQGPVERIWPRLPLAATRLAATIAYRHL